MKYMKIKDEDLFSIYENINELEKLRDIRDAINNYKS